MTRVCWVCIAAVAAAACGGPKKAPVRQASEVPVEPTQKRPSSVAEEGFLTRYAKTNHFELGRPAQIKVVPGGESVLFLRSGPRSFVRSLYEFDVETGKTRKILTAKQLLGQQDAELSEEERARRERLRLAARGITRYELSKDGERILVPLSGRLFLYDRDEDEVTELPGEGGYANDAHLSPDGTKVACVREGELYVIDLDRGKQRRLTDSASEHVTNGMPEFVAQEEMRRYQGFWWSPDSKRIAYQQTDTSEVEVLHAADPMHPSKEPKSAPYPRAGTDNAEVRLGVIPVRGGRTKWIEWDRDGYPYLATVRWSKGAPLTLLVQNRKQTKQRLLTADARSGKTATLLEEEDEAWINLDQSVPQWLGKGERFLWSSERTGQWQLELRSRAGELVRTLTSPQVGYSKLIHVDEEDSVAWVAGSDDPTETHIWQVPLAEEGAPPKRVTQKRGVHAGSFGRDTDVWVHRSHTLEHAPVFNVRRGGGQGVGTLPNKAEAPKFEPDPEFVTVGEKNFHAVVIRPRNFDPNVRYPVIVSVYGGPGHRVVRAARQRYLYHQWLADHGYIVVRGDGRGTPGRGRDWERAIAGNFIDVPLKDQVTILKALGERYPEMDLGRVGVYGWSFGGYFSAMAVMRKPEIFDVGFAGAPVTDWHDYDTHYTERYLGLPDENEQGYRKSNVLTYVGELRKPLLIAHGTLDDNVYFTHAIKLSDALLRAGKPHDFLPLSGFTHMVADPGMTRSLQSRLVGFLDKHLE